MNTAFVAFACGIMICGSIPWVNGLDNGLGITPPRGWRSWDAFENSINQTLMENQIAAMMSTTRLVDGKPTSLLELGYISIGLDDSWQDCGAGLNKSFHSANGIPLVNTERFPDMKGMVQKIHRGGLQAGFYLNNCDCSERGALRPNWGPQMHGDAATVATTWKFDGLKVDSCGPSQDLSLWARELNATNRPVLLENCFDNASFPYLLSGAENGDGERIPEEACPMNMFRTGGDMRAQWPLMLRRLQTIAPWARLSRPGCWAYLDMLEVGNPPGGTGEQVGFENFHSWRAHFGAWAVMSSPLILSFDLTNQTKMDLVWPIITNKEALAVNAAWDGDAGRLVESEYDMSAPTPVFMRPCADVVDTQRWIYDARTKTISSASNGDTRCLAVPGCPAQQSPRSYTEKGGTLTVAKCNATSPAQLWNVTTGTDGQITTVASLSAIGQGCWEINGCSTANGASVDTSFGCKALPPKGWSPTHGNLCDANMAWRFNANGTVTSVMDGGCLEVSPQDEFHVVVGTCDGSPRQQFSIQGDHIVVGTGNGTSGDGPQLCVDGGGGGGKPAYPQYGPLRITSCAVSRAGAWHDVMCETEDDTAVKRFHRLVYSTRACSMPIMCNNAR
eukprot:m.1252709 g.1252709  ORF g.1252709 m.1252709 type:complete len:617 (-) comp24703_c0_seq73:4205-6055(-)